MGRVHALFAGRRHLAAVVSATVAIAGLLLGGCGAGQITQTASQNSAVNGALFDVGPIAVRDAQLAYPDTPDGIYRPGAEATVVATIVNNGAANDRLESVRSPYFDGSRLGGNPSLPAGASLRSGTDVDDQQRPAPAEGNGQPSARPAPQQGIGTVRITLTGLNRQSLRSGINVPVRFSFGRAGSHTALLPIGAPADEPGGAQ